MAPLTQSEWSIISEVIAALEPTYQLGKVLQYQELLPGKFFSQWKDAQVQLNSNGSELAILLSIEMEKRGSLLFNNNMFLAALYVDANYRLALSEEQLSRGKATFVRVVQQLSLLKSNSAAEAEVVIEIDQNHSVDLWSESSNLSAFEQQLDERQGQLRAEIPESLASKLNVLESIPRSRTGVLEQIPKLPQELQDAAYAVTAYSCTQVTVERLFSKFRLTVTHLRASIGANLLDGIVYLIQNGI